MVLSLAAILLQFVFTGYILTGVACTCCILLVHLSTQSNSLVSDELTGTFKRQVFLQMIEMHLRDGKKGDIIALALRDFKFANEVFGVKTCDRLLKEVAGFLKELAPTGRVYRFDGDVFCIAEPGGEENTDRVVNIIVDRFRKPWHFQGIDYSLNCSLGVVPMGKKMCIRDSLQPNREGQYAVTNSVSRITFTKEGHTGELCANGENADAILGARRPLKGAKFGLYTACLLYTSGDYKRNNKRIYQRN